MCRENTEYFTKRLVLLTFSHVLNDSHIQLVYVKRSKSSVKRSTFYPRHQWCPFAGWIRRCRWKYWTRLIQDWNLQCPKSLVDCSFPCSAFICFTHTCTPYLQVIPMLYFVSSILLHKQTIFHLQAVCHHSHWRRVVNPWMTYYQAFSSFFATYAEVIASSSLVTDLMSNNVQ